MAKQPNLVEMSEIPTTRQIREPKASAHHCSQLGGFAVGSVTQSHLTLCNPMDWSLPGSSVHGISQARLLEWVAIFNSRGVFLTQGLNPSLLHLLHWQVDSLPLVPPGKPLPMFTSV